MANTLIDQPYDPFSNFQINILIILKINIEKLVSVFFITQPMHTKSSLSFTLFGPTAPLYTCHLSIRSMNIW